MLDNLKYKDALYSENIPGQKVSVRTISTLCLVSTFLFTNTGVDFSRAESGAPSGLTFKGAKSL